MPGKKLIIRIAGHNRAATLLLKATRKPHVIYIAPDLMPANGARFAGVNASIDLQWASVGILEEGEWYQVKLWTENPEEAERFWTKSTTLVVPSNLYRNKETEFHWSVSVVYKGRKIIPLSPAEAPRTFSWK